MEEKTELEWLENWMLERGEEELSKDRITTIELVLEFLHTRGLLTTSGIELECNFCKKYIHESLPVAKISVIKDMDNKEAKKRISEYLNKIDGNIFPSEIAEHLHIDYSLCVEVIEELLKEKKIEIVED
ncbi:hypothetical protein KAW18_01960 [candidate division WOR-3 bacterium]|nr:hypothetical protein [candidate division WOR-3 bacterium]